MISLRQYKHLILFVILAICGSSQPLGAEPLPVRSAALVLHPEQPSENRLGNLRYLGGLILASEDSRFGGYSGIAIDADGGGLWAISDLGHWLRLDFGGAEVAPGRIASAAILPLRDAAGRPVGSKRDSDAEALRRLPDGQWLVSFERAHRVWLYAEPGGAALVGMALPDAASKQPGNGGIESVAALPDGDLLLFSEEHPAGDDAAAVWMRRGNTWTDLAWPLRDGFKPTDAAGLPNGDVMVLERYFMPLIGPKARLRRIPAAALTAGGSLLSSVVAEWARPSSVDNMEALDIRRAADGALWLYLLSDDNANPLQRTLLMVFRLDE